MSPPSPPPADPVPGRPLLKPALRRLWRDPSTVQLGLTAQHAVVLSGLTAADVAVLDHLGGSDRAAAAGPDCASAGAPDAAGAPGAHRLLRSLAAAGALDERAEAWQPEDDRQRLEPDRLSLSLRHRDPGAADRLLRRRTQAAVTAYGGGRVGAAVVRLLAAAGVGTVACVDDQPLRRSDLAPAGVADAVTGTRAEAVHAALGPQRPQRAATTTATVPRLAVVAPAAAVARPEVLRLVRGLPHLLVVVRETTAFVGPFVVPGVTPCLRCLELARTDRDPAWPVLAAQLAGSTRGVDACDVALATLAAAVCTLHALTWLDTGELPPSAGAVLEVDVTGARLRRRSLHAHPDCGCGAAG